MTGVDFALDVTLNRDQKITAAFAGDLLQGHATACACARNAAMRARSVRNGEIFGFDAQLSAADRILRFLFMLRMSRKGGLS